ncbi:indole-3-glycerol phosphate synthase [Methanohalophilus euhalobius]|uniref:Indole-3-glycerol phosphate synthase n=1 Tax=Methanohalophilus euhalobius TaxID=51203 RepID=A0A285EZ96_9EURY|nr:MULTISPECIES: indole-3-glycerol-phosphate synthase [Methanohalophilus]ODV48976.1 MAG: indole-3-glycerol phosphate synthase [Methanohalophilus sp. 2-GBenrich]RSD35747.1 MAG: indole-3-glycerol phosphate synthase [Methanohalophilus sp.]TCL12842.1 indole-3-glycerol phosphate synthase [Methanohalophilus euhalobius]SNY03496.1 indole-3-glycerol phosphate synthase [Methanohalophilus euhalobius]
MHPKIEQIIQKSKERADALSESNTYTRHNDIRDIFESIGLARSRGHIPIIAEVKPASPTGKFADVNPEMASQIACDMENAGAVALSVLTEPCYFEGSIENLESARKHTSIPVLRKDFIVDKNQMHEASSDVILLIAGILGKRLPEFIEIARRRNIEPLVEVHNKKELDYALECDTILIGINNRSFETLEIDLETAEKLIPLVKEHDRKYNQQHLIIGESGVKSTDDAARMIKAGADALLVGTYLMEGNLKEKMKQLIEANKNQEIV